MYLFHRRLPSPHSVYIQRRKMRKEPLQSLTELLLLLLFPRLSRVSFKKLYSLPVYATERFLITITFNSVYSESRGAAAARVAYSCRAREAPVKYYFKRPFSSGGMREKKGFEKKKKNNDEGDVLSRSYIRADFVSRRSEDETLL